MDPPSGLPPPSPTDPATIEDTDSRGEGGTEPGSEAALRQTASLDPRSTWARNLGVVAVVVALVAGGYMLRWRTEPTKTNTVTKTVAPPAYATHQRYRAEVQLTGAPKLEDWNCAYSGPAEIRARSHLRLVFSTVFETMPAGGSPESWVVRLEPGTSWTQLWDAYGLHGAKETLFAAGPPLFVARPGDSSKWVGRSEGIYAVGCSLDHIMIPATILRVVSR